MTMDWYDEPDEDEGDDVASSWGIPLNEPAPTARPTDPPTEDPPATLLFRPHDFEPEAEFHPRLRRFGEAS